MHKFNKIQTLLKNMKMDDFIDEIPKDINCEICETNKSKLLRKKLYLAINKFDIFQFIVVKIVDLFFKRKSLVEIFIIITTQKFIEKLHLTQKYLLTYIYKTKKIEEKNYSNF